MVPVPVRVPPIDDVGSDAALLTGFGSELPSLTAVSLESKQYLSVSGLSLVRFEGNSIWPKNIKTRILGYLMQREGE